MKRLKKMIPLLALSALMAIGITGCSGSGNEDALAEIKENGKIVLGTAADYPPFEFVDKQNNIVGMDIEIAKEIAKDMGVELEIKNMQFESLLTSLNADKVDIILSGMNPTPERVKAVDFSDVYYESKHFVIINAEDKDAIKTEADLEGKTIGVQVGSTQEQLAKATFTKSQFTSLPAIPDLMLLLENGKVDAVVTEDAVAKTYAETNSKLYLPGMEYENAGSGVAVAMRKDSAELKAQINKTIKRLKDEGKIEQLFNDAVKLSGESVK